MLHDAAGWERCSLKYKGRYVSGVRNLGQATSAGDAPTRCTKESRAVASSVPKNLATKWSPFAKEKSELFSWQLPTCSQKNYSNKFIPFPPKLLTLLPLAFNSAATQRAHSGGRGFFPVMSMLVMSSSGKKSWEKSCLRASE